MSEVEVKTSGSGIGIAGVLTVVFVILKALGYLSWSWWWVFSPLWISTGIFLVIAILFIVAVITGNIINDNH